jgi:hypothetical protein
MVVSLPAQSVPADAPVAGRLEGKPPWSTEGQQRTSEKQADLQLDRATRNLVLKATGALKWTNWHSRFAEQTAENALFLSRR